jgi:hypothetical protein
LKGRKKPVPYFSGADEAFPWRETTMKIFSGEYPKASIERLLIIVYAEHVEWWKMRLESLLQFSEYYGSPCSYIHKRLNLSYCNGHNTSTQLPGKKYSFCWCLYTTWYIFFFFFVPCTSYHNTVYSPTQHADMPSYHWLRRHRRAQKTIRIALVKNWETPWRWFLREPKHVGVFNVT